MILLLSTFLGMGNNNWIPHYHYKEIRKLIWSKNVQDSFIIYISYLTKIGAEKKKIDTVFYYLDAELKSGNYLRKQLKNPQKRPTNFLYVGIAHIGNYHVKRRRDFIPPPYDSSGYQDANFGKADKFYSFLTDEIMPIIEKNFDIKPENQLIGHSLGGLFGIYALTKKDSHFDTYYCLSPSLWINHYDIIKSIEHDSLNLGKVKKLYLLQGGLEFYNKIKKGNKMLIKTFKRKQLNLIINVKSYPLEGHNGYVNKSLGEILNP